MKTGKETLLKLYRSMLRIRMLEDAVADIYPRGEMRTPTHFSIGQEAVSAGVCLDLKKTDAVFASHRCHAAYLAKGGDMNGMTAELFGRETGVCGGRSGSAHLSSPEHNMFAAPILGAMIPVAVGAGLSFSMQRPGKAAVAFFGDAAVEEGAFAESVNFAVLKKLSVLFVCENNLFSTHTHVRYRQPGAPIYKRVRAMGIKSLLVDGMDAADVYEKTAPLIKDIRKGKGPYFIECATYRYREHVGPLYDFQNPYRTKEEVRAWMRKCPVARLEKQLIAKKAAGPAAIAKLRQSVKKEVKSAIEFARRSKWPRAKTLTENVY